MFSEINSKLSAAKERYLRYEKVQRDLERARQRLEADRLRLAELQARLEKEGEDVDRLERLSLAGLFYTVLGSKEQQLDKERQELLAVKLKHSQARFAVSTQEAEVAALERELDQLSDAQAEYQSLLAEKENLLATSDSHEAGRLITVGEEQAELLDAQKEVREALQAGRSALSGLARMADALQSAGNWGAWDMLGGGLVATAVKRSRMDEAREIANNTQYLLRKFQGELMDIGSAEGITFQSDGLEAFADFFFDGLIVDWVVQSRINQALSNVQTFYRRMESLLRRLERQQESLSVRLERLEEEKQRLIEEAH